MAWNQILALHKMGFEIGNHTGHHRNVTKLSRQGMEDELSYIEEKCKAFGVPKPISFAYPGNRYDAMAQVILKEKGYHYARAGSSRTYNIMKDSNLAIPSYTVASSKKLKTRVTTAIHNLKKGETLVLTFHGVPDNIHPDYSTSLEFLEELLQYMKEKAYRVIAIRNLKIN